MASIALVHAQQPEPTSFRPDVTIVVREHSLGADMVEVTMSADDYPVDLLQQQVTDLGARLGSPPRGLQVGVEQLDPANAKLRFVKARFAVDGIIDRPNGIFRLQPIAQAFAGAPEPHVVSNIMLVLDGEKPLPGKTVQRFPSESVDVVGTVVQSPPLIEYRIALKSQDPERLLIPESVAEPAPVKKPSVSPSGTPVLFWIAIGVAGLAIGALVYLALLRSGAGRAASS